MITYKVSNIKYDTDGDEELAESLPKEMTLKLENNDDPSIELADKISDKTGFLVFNFDFEKVPLTEQEQFRLDSIKTGLNVKLAFLEQEVKLLLVDDGDTSELSQRMGLINALNQVSYLVNGIQYQDLKESELPTE